VEVEQGVSGFAADAVGVPLALTKQYVKKQKLVGTKRRATKSMTDTNDDVPAIDYRCEDKNKKLLSWGDILV
jgi:hypothetical protein